MIYEIRYRSRQIKLYKTCKKLGQEIKTSRFHSFIMFTHLATHSWNFTLPSDVTSVTIERFSSKSTFSKLRFFDTSYIQITSDWSVNVANRNCWKSLHVASSQKKISPEMKKFPETGFLVENFDFEKKKKIVMISRIFNWKNLFE